jgi:RNA polymerase sigma factor (sigma-70 family)
MTVQRDAAFVQLARRAADGDASSLEDLLRELEPLVVRTARLIVGSGSWAAEDAAQEALVDVAQGIATLRDPEAARAWALRVTTRRALKVARCERLVSRNRVLAVPELAAGPADQRSSAIKGAFDQLPPKLRATAILRLYVGLTERETAAALGCSLGTVKSNLHDARGRLATALVERGLAPAVRVEIVEETG